MTGILCDECGTRFEPMTDAYKCPLCGAENYPDDDDGSQPCRCCGRSFGCYCHEYPHADNLECPGLK